MSLLEKCPVRIVCYSIVLLSFFHVYAQSETAQTLSRFVISADEMDGFTIIREPSYYGPQNLWNYINGGALPYLDYNVSDVVTYMMLWVPDSLEIVVDVYDMSDSLGAFGIYSNERFPEYNYIDIGVEGYLTENTLCFWKDHYYIKVFSNVNSPPTLEPVEKIARTIDELIPVGGGMSVYFSLFPAENKLEKTESYIAKNVLGQDFLKNAFIINYKRGEEEYQLCLIKAPTEGDASRNFQAYHDFLGEYGELVKKKVSVGDEAFLGKEGWYGSILFVRKGTIILTSVGLSDIDLAQRYIQNMISELP